MRYTRSRLLLLFIRVYYSTHTLENTAAAVNWPITFEAHHSRLRPPPALDYIHYIPRGSSLRLCRARAFTRTVFLSLWLFVKEEISGILLWWNFKSIPILAIGGN